LGCLFKGERGAGGKKESERRRLRRRDVPDVGVRCVGEAIGQSNVLRTGQTLKGKRG
jgi:hypothetical protein